MESRAEWEAQSVLQLVNPCWLHTAIENLNRDQQQRLDYIQYIVQNMQPGVELADSGTSPNISAPDPFSTPRLQPKEVNSVALIPEKIICYTVK